MNNDMNAKLNSILSNMSQKDLQNLIRMTKESSILSRLTPADRQKLINEFSKLDSGETKRKLSSINSSELSKISADELIRKIRSI